MEDFIYFFFIGILIGACLSLGSRLQDSRDFSRPYRELVEAMCPETDPDVYIDSNNIVRIVYDCSQE